MQRGGSRRSCHQPALRLLPVRRDDADPQDRLRAAVLVRTAQSLRVAASATDVDIETPSGLRDAIKGLNESIVTVGGTQRGYDVGDAGRAKRRCRTRASQWRRGGRERAPGHRAAAEGEALGRLSMARARQQL